MANKEYIRIPAFIRTHFQHLSLAEKWLYICLVDICQYNKEYRLDLRNLEKETGLAKATLSAAIPHLDASGLIRAQKKSSGGTKHEAWHVTLHPLTLEQAQSLSARFEKRETENSAAKEIDIVNAQLARAIGASTPATLTITEWLDTLDHFQWKCAYCQGPYEVLEHFIPMVLGGGTTQGNCVPSCASCNNKKNGYHPLLFPAHVGMTNAIEQVSQYLSSYR